MSSDIRRVIIHPKQGCLQWLHGTMSEPPWKSHWTRKDHYSLRWPPTPPGPRWPPALLLLLERERTEVRKREKFYIYADVTHTHTLCKPAQSKRMSRFQSHFMRKFTGKMPQTRVSTLIKHRPLHLSIVRNLSVAHCLGNKPSTELIKGAQH